MLFILDEEKLKDFISTLTKDEAIHALHLIRRGRTLWTACQDVFAKRASQTIIQYCAAFSEKETNKTLKIT